jgi:hypothetical protein
MALNDRDVTLGGNLGVDVHPGLANPTSASTHSDPMAANFVSRSPLLPKSFEWADKELTG